MISLVFTSVSVTFQWPEAALRASLGGAARARPVSGPCVQRALLPRGGRASARGQPGAGVPGTGPNVWVRQVAAS